MMKDLFSDNRTDSLTITAPSTEHSIHPMQHEFNGLILKISEQEKKYERHQAMLENKLHYVIRNLLPVHHELNRLKNEFIKILYVYFRDLKLSTKRKELLAEYILDIHDQLIMDDNGLSDAEIDSLNALISKVDVFLYGESSKKEEEEVSEYLFTEILSEVRQHMKSNGFDLDLSGLNSKMSPEEISSYMEEEVRKAGLEPGIGTKKFRKRKFKKQLQNDKARQLMEEKKNRSISSIYRLLAKAIHPDLEPDADKKNEKDELMKQVTRAYKERDLRTLLRLELIWIQGEQNRVDHLADDQLAVYNALLKEQLAELKLSIKEIIFQTRFAPLILFTGGHRVESWKPEYELVQLNQIRESNRKLLHILQKNNKESRDQLNTLLDNFR